MIMDPYSGIEGKVKGVLFVEVCVRLAFPMRSLECA